jgi:hypothetical protein
MGTIHQPSDFQHWINVRQPSDSGWWRCYCPLCEDPGTSKSSSAGLNFKTKRFKCHHCGASLTIAALKKEMAKRSIVGGKDNPATGVDPTNFWAEGDFDEDSPAADEQVWKPQEDQPAAPPAANNEPTQADILIAIAYDRYEFIKGDVGDGEPFALPKRGPNLARPLRGSNSFRAELSAAFFDQEGKVPNSNALANVLLTLEGRTLVQPRTPLALRVARHDQGVVIDLGGDTGLAVVIKPGHWGIEQRSPVIFRRTSISRALPLPEDPNLAALWPLVNVPDEMRPLVVAYMVAALLSDIPHPVLAITGEQGTGKSWTSGRIIALLDPTSTPLRAVQKQLDDWVVAAAASWVVGLENLSHIEPWLSDAMCRAVTGDSLLRRKLYTDSDVSAVAFRRTVLLNGIALGVIRGDLADRMILVELEQLAKRRSEKALDKAWNFAYPLILAGLYEVTCRVLDALPNVAVGDPPRMVDYAHVLAAVDQVMGTSGLAVYRGMWGRLAADVAESDPVARVLIKWMANRATWQGTAGQLLEELDKRVGVAPPQGWPRTAQGMGWALKRLAAALRSQGLEVEHLERDGHDNRQWRFGNPEVTPGAQQEGWS